MKRSAFLHQMSVLAALAALPRAAKSNWISGSADSGFPYKLVPVGRRLELEGCYVWCNSPIFGPDNKVHVYFSRWKSAKKMGGWLNGCEIAHAVADHPEAEYKVVDTVLAPREGYWDSTTCHNPHIQYVDGIYCLFYMGNSNGKTDTKRIGIATSKSLYGPWTRSDEPLLQPGEAGAWDDHCTTNPAFVKHPNGQYWLYYKSWNSNDYYNSKDPSIRGNRKYGLAISNYLLGPYKRHSSNPVIDFSSTGNNNQFEDAFVWREKGKFKMLARDMGVFNHEVGLYLDSSDGINWNRPEIAYEALKEYIDIPPAPAHLKRYGRLERPQILFKDEKPAYLFTASQGGLYETASSFILKII